ncbi:orotidine-5'-phosphate decarboxylase [Ruminococcaceae bacterium OttesenSCG-928-O06]|nr:orotidine-5'-phosphate decarboxylase [Ruminococcaceae bacterium OttesenSCG-928-O06]
MPCDFPSRAELVAFLDRFDQQTPYLKIGMELFYGEGPDIVREVKARGHNVFLDLKLHDIPNTVHRAMKNIARLGVDMVNLHAAGGSAMMRAALEGLEEGAAGTRPQLIAVTMLTSIGQEAMNGELLIPGVLDEVVASYATNAQGSGLDGVVCSPLEVPLVKEWCGPEFITVTPGIRYPASAGDDQARVTTPAEAARIGSDYIVVGRPITAAGDPVAAYQKVLAEFSGG